MTGNPKRRRMALPLGAGLIGALVAAFTIFAAAMPAAAADGGGTFNYTMADTTVSAMPGDNATVTLNLTGITAGEGESIMSACWTLAGDSITANTSGSVTFDPTTDDSVDITIPIDAGATAGDTATLSVAATCDHGSNGSANDLTDTATGTDTAVITVEAGTTTTSVTSVTPNSGPTGTDVTIAGVGFTGATAVSFGSTAVASYTVDSDTQISTTIPSGLTPGVVSATVTSPSGSDTLASAFTVESASGTVTLTSVSPTSGPVGTEITLTGTGLTGATGVTVGGVAATNVTVVSDTSVTANVPTTLDTGTYDVMVTTPAGSDTLTDAFEVTEATAPTVTALDPTSGGPGTTVTITGTGFTGATGVTFGGTDAASFTVDSDTQITAVAPAGMDMGEIDVIVTTPAGSSATSDASKFDNTGNVADQTVTVTLQGQFTLIGWIGEDNMAVGDALKGGPDGPHNGTNDITSKVSVVWGFDASTQTWQAYFPAQANVAGANDLTNLHTGLGYFIGLVNPATPVQWTMEFGNVASSSNTSS